MKVFYIGPRRTSELKYLNDKIVKIIEENGQTVDKSLINAKYSDDIVHFEKAYKRNIQSTKSCDILIVEVTEPSTSSGYVISYALSERKPVLALINSEKSKSFPVSLKGSDNKLFTLKEYTEHNLKKIIHEYLFEVKSILDTKFILIISPQINRYMQWVSDNRRMHKAQVVRQALEDMLAKDKEYKEFLKEK